MAELLALPPPPAPSPEDEFGATPELTRKREAQGESSAPRLTELDATVARVTRRRTGHLVIRLENGQTWEQKEVMSNFVVRAGEQVKITAGALGAYFLTNEEGRRTRVKRIK